MKVTVVCVKLVIAAIAPEELEKPLASLWEELVKRSLSVVFMLLVVELVLCVKFVKLVVSIVTLLLIRPVLVIMPALPVVMVVRVTVVGLTLVRLLWLP